MGEREPVRYRGWIYDSARWGAVRLRPGDVVISTPPKCGTTWTQMICVLLVLQRADIGAPLSVVSPWVDMLTTPIGDVVGALEAQRAAREVGATGLCLAGGVAANSLLRERWLDLCTEDDVRCFLPSRSLCTDNAAMVAAAGWWRLRSDGPTPLDTGADPNLKL